MKGRILFVALAVAGCSSLEGRFVEDPKLDKIEKAKGVTYYLSRPHFEVQRKTLAGGKKAQPVAEVVLTSAPDYSRRFEVGMDRGWFSSDSFEVSLSDEGTLTALTAESTDQTGKVVSELINLTAQVAGASLLSAGSDLKAVFQQARQGDVINDAEKNKANAAINTIFADPKKPDLSDAAKVANFKQVATKVLDHLSGDGTASSFQSVRQVLAALDNAMTQDTARTVFAPDAFTTEANNVEKVLKRAELLQKALDDVEAPAGSAVVTKTLEALKKAVDTELAKAINDLPTPANQSQLDAAVAKYKAAVELILNADVHGRALGKRRKELVEFLQQDISDNLAANESTAYVQFSKELADVSAAISALVSPAKPAPAELPLATDVTSKIEEKVHVTRFSSYISDPAVQKRHVAVARARVRFGGANAAILVHPLTPEVSQ